MPFVAGVEVYGKGELLPGAIGFAGAPVGYSKSGFTGSCVIMVWTKGYMEWMDTVAARAQKAAPKVPK